MRSGTGDDETILVNLATGAELRLKGRQVYHYVAIKNEKFSGFSPDGRQVFTSTVPRSDTAGDKGYSLLAWDYKTGENLFAVADTSHAIVTMVPETNRILAAGQIFDPLKKETLAHFDDGQMARDHRRLLVSGYAYSGPKLAHAR